MFVAVLLRPLFGGGVLVGELGGDPAGDACGIHVGEAGGDPMVGVG